MKSIQIRKACMAARVFVMTRQFIKKEKRKKGKKEKKQRIRISQYVLIFFCKDGVIKAVRLCRFGTVLPPLLLSFSLTHKHTQHFLCL